jgi:hypothetical protein
MEGSGKKEGLLVRDLVMREVQEDKLTGNREHKSKSKSEVKQVEEEMKRDVSDQDGKKEDQRVAGFQFWIGYGIERSYVKGEGDCKGLETSGHLEK